MLYTPGASQDDVRTSYRTTVRRLHCKGIEFALNSALYPREAESHTGTRTFVLLIYCSPYI